MHADRLRRRAALGVAALVAACSCVTALGAAGAAAPVKLGGNWSGSYNGTYAGTFVLKWTQKGARLTGTIKLSSPSTIYRITGSVAGHAIKFGTVGGAIHYSGSVSGLGISMSGHWAGGPASGTWSAHKLKSSIKVKLP